MPDDRAVESPSLSRRLARLLSPSHQHSALSATVLLMAAMLASRVIGYLREAYIAWRFGAGPDTDVYFAAFTIPDFLNHLMAGGAISITFISMFARYSAAGKRADAERAFSIVITVLAALLSVGIVITEVFAPWLVKLIFPGFTPEQIHQCAFLVRILLPAQLFFLVGGVLSAVLASERRFLLPALAPLLYSIFIILGGVLLGDRYGVAGLAIGAVVGSLVGPFLVNAVGVARSGMRYSPSFDTGHAAFREWVRLSIPLAIGVSVVVADQWILRYFASGGAGDITRLHYAKRLFDVPIAVLAQAAGQASLPFFAKLFGESRREDFSRSVSSSVYRVSAVAVLAAAWIMSASYPLVDLVYRRGHFSVTDSEETAIFLFIFALSLPLWAAQAILVRAFYAAGNTLTPMVAGTVVTVASLPVYYLLFETFDVVGLAWASNVAIAAHTIAILALLHARGLMRISALPWGAFFKTVAIAALAGLLAWFVGKSVPEEESYTYDVLVLALTFVTWAAAVLLGLRIIRSDLLTQLRRR